MLSWHSQDAVGGVTIGKGLEILRWLSRTGGQRGWVERFVAPYTRMKNGQAVALGVDLDSLWMQLGVRIGWSSVQFDDTRNCSCIRRGHQGRNSAGGGAAEALPRPSKPLRYLAGRGP